MIDIVYSDTFIKELKSYKGTPSYKAIKHLCFEIIPELNSLQDIPSLKKMEGFTNYFRIRKGDYRIGIKIEDSKIYFLRCLHRKDIYKYFP